VKTVQNSQRSKAGNAVVVIEPRGKEGRGGKCVKCFRGLEACNSVTVTVRQISQEGLCGRHLEYTYGKNKCNF
jgi:hypothetical protein